MEYDDRDCEKQSPCCGNQNKMTYFCINANANY